jgi:hypothetical protein
MKFAFAGLFLLIRHFQKTEFKEQIVNQKSRHFCLLFGIVRKNDFYSVIV